MANHHSDAGTRRCYHLPTDITVPDGLSAQDGERLRTTVLAALRGAVRDAAPEEETVPPPASPRPRPRERAAGSDNRLHAVPSYDNGGEKVGIPVASPSPAPAGGPRPSPRDPANPHNILTADEMYDIWIAYWTARHNRAHELAEKIREDVWRRNPPAFSRNFDRFQNGRRDALGPAYEAAANDRDFCTFMVSAMPDVLRWLKGQQLLGRPVTFARLNKAAYDMARAQRALKTYLEPLALAALAVSVPTAGSRAPAPEEIPASPRLPAAEVPPPPPGTPSAPGGFLAWTRGWALRVGVDRAMVGTDTALPPTRVAASSSAPTETSPAPTAPPRIQEPRPAPPEGTSPRAPDQEPAPAARAPEPTAPAARRFDLTEPTLTTEDVFAQIGNELAHLPTAAPSGTGPAAAVADARAAGLIGPQGAPGTADLAVQRHADASAVRGAYGVSGAQVQSAHAGPTSFLRDVPGYSRRDAPTTLLPDWVHTAFDQHWKNWAMARRRAGDTRVKVAQLYAEMLTAVDRIPLLDQATRNTIAWVIHRELFYDLGLSPGDDLTLPYPNVPPSP
ncbi:hypothetical protein AB0E08_21760 [Streptomyces sp. NPDC048281]|uniref:hypothetical protein n=1 Tax=Streptomyces sp. NPDC048281 TaxID=3154715 RepID=UPI00342E60FB